MELRELLFFRTQEEFRTYYNMAKSKYYTDEERERQRERFASVFRVIQDAGLEEEYREWKKKNIPELQD
ncbi:hypothetical protein [Eubacterium sp. An3]|mgnify:FL=1|uniref:hypothetical protein n=1 Tax=Eubacterium sp. An3 TaxID=1965628 RepID=UPI000B3AD340|nr:hypothetical protein [Eubacterium sp. An3]OUO29671.1 hypothetical protein B5F87_03975 [Eubacterium sp. An3]